MTAPKWTPGPWVVDADDRDYGACVRTSAEPCVSVAWCGPASAVSAFGSYSVLLEEVHANARLIAAAPDLAEALEAVIADITADNDTWAPDSSVELARAALAKARGDA